MLGTVLGLVARHVGAPVSRRYAVRYNFALRRSWRMAALAAAILPIALGRFSFRPVLICGNSMAPTLRDGQVVPMETRSTEPIRRGDVVVFHRGRESCVKRVVAVGGDTVCLIRFACGNVELLEYKGPYRDYTHQAFRALSRLPYIGRVERVSIPAHSLFVMGDNEGISDDSRSFGPIAESSVMGHISVRPAYPSRFSLAARAVGGCLVMPVGARLPDFAPTSEPAWRPRDTTAGHQRHLIATL